MRVSSEGTLLGILVIAVKILQMYVVYTLCVFIFNVVYVGHYAGV
jgi:hypothetical protein